MLPCIALPACGTGHAGKELHLTILLPLLEPLGGPVLLLVPARLLGDLALHVGLGSASSFALCGTCFGLL
jgi:hypothetical protein